MFPERRLRKQIYIYIYIYIYILYVLLCKVFLVAEGECSEQFSFLKIN